MTVNSQIIKKRNLQRHYILEKKEVNVVITFIVSKQLYLTKNAAHIDDAQLILT